MSYSFSWDCTLPINNIQDIVSINIVPETKMYNEGDYLSLRGQICIEGEYVGNTREQHAFVEKIPLDITLPNNGRVEDIVTEVTNFDYEVQSGRILFLKVDLVLIGYDFGNDEAFQSEWDENQIDTMEVDYMDLDELVLDRPEESVDFSKSGDVGRKEKQKVVIEEKVIIKEEVKPEVAVVVEEVKPEVAVVVEEVKPEVAVVVEEVKPEVAVVVEEVKAEVIVEEEVCEEEEEILPFPLKEEEVVIIEESVEPTQSDLFDMLYHLDKETEEIKVVESADLVEVGVEIPEVVEVEQFFEVMGEEEVVIPEVTSGYDESIAGQFADGASILKIVFIQQEETTVADICSQYEVAEHAICNLDELDFNLSCGDRVMINYGRIQ